MDLARSLTAYYARPGPVTFRAVEAAIFAYDMARFVDDQAELFDIRAARSLWGGRSYGLESTGTTTGRVRGYPFGPHWAWMDVIEGVVKHPTGRRTTVLVTNRMGSYFAVPAMLSVPHRRDRHYDYHFDVRGWDDRAVDFLLISLAGLVARHGPVCLVAHPRTFLYLTSTPEFCSFVAAAGVSLASTNSEPFYKAVALRAAGVHINDHMVDWQTGHNFFRCERHGLHVLPIFAARDGLVYNLLNLTYGPVLPDDRFVIRGTGPCACGRAAVDLDFVPHMATAIPCGAGYWYDPGLAERLSGRYQNLQFVLHDGEMQVLHRGDGREDLPLLVSEVERRGYPAVPLANHGMHVGLKTPAFYHDRVGRPLTSYVAML